MSRSQETPTICSLYMPLVVNLKVPPLWSPQHTPWLCGDTQGRIAHPRHTHEPITHFETCLSSQASVLTLLWTLWWLKLFQEWGWPVLIEWLWWSLWLRSKQNDNLEFQSQLLKTFLNHELSSPCWAKCAVPGIVRSTLVWMSLV